VDASEPRNLAPDLPARLSRALRGRLERLRGMSPAEIGYRLLRAVQARTERSRVNGERPAPAPDLAARGNPWIRNEGNSRKALYVAAAERIAQGGLDLHALKGVDLGSPPRWNREPKSGIEAPLVFGKLLDIGDADLVGDIKYLWQPNRHGHLVTLAQAYALTGKRAYLELIEEHLDSWFLACPYGLGPNWSNAFEAALRLINWTTVWQLLAGHKNTFAGKEDFQQRWLSSIYQHCEFIRGWFTLHASTGHRLIGEAAALFLAALTWPHWRESRAWAATAKAILEREALAQTAPDGVHREQSVGAQLVVLDLLQLTLLAGKANGQWFSPDYESRIEAMLDFIASIMDAGGNVPAFGDADGSSAAPLSPAADFSLARSLLATGAILFKRGDFKLKAGKPDERVRWLLGAQADAQFAALDVEATRLPLRQAFPEGGYFVAGCAFDTRAEIRLIADAGALGHRAAAAHGHADALSFTLSVGGLEFFVDPGTYAYHTQQAWRRYFRGTAAHNTLRVDGLDQSEQARAYGGLFSWKRKARAGCSLWLSSPEKDSFEGWHDGYMRLDDPVKHRRLIELDKAARRIAIEDTLEMGEEHDVELFFHLSERCEVHPAGEGFVISQGNISMRIVLPVVDGASSRVYQGNLAPLHGWRSPAFDMRVAAPTIVWQARLSGAVRLRTEMAIG
jgi:hypothetical protein